MFKMYAAKVVSILGGLRDNGELELVRDGYERGLSPKDCANYICNNRL